MNTTTSPSYCQHDKAAPLRTGCVQCLACGEVFANVAHLEGASTDAARAAIDTLSRAMDQQEHLLDQLGCHPSIIDSCTENVRDLGMGEAHPDYWREVLSQLVSELDSHGVVVHADYSISVR